MLEPAKLQMNWANANGASTRRDAAAAVLAIPATYPSVESDVLRDRGFVRMQPPLAERNRCYDRRTDNRRGA
ncbi:hypothetical protein [Streptomyces sp. NPDC051994]|uniref:hypothetical protein n=1 Tax=unclassified Streptomyces TaxID=2593676 RepID=UPI0034459CDD